MSIPLVISVVAVLAAGFLYLAGKSSAPPKIDVSEIDAAPSRAAGKARLVVFCPTAGATANLDGRDLGAFPLDLEVTAGEAHWLRVEAPGHAPDVRSIELQPDQEERIEVELRALSAAELKKARKVKPLVVRGLVSDDAFQRALESYRRGRFGTARKQLLTISRKASDPSVQGAARTMARYIGKLAETLTKLEASSTPEHELPALAQKAINLDRSIDEQENFASRIQPRYLEGLFARGMRSLRDGRLRAARKDLRSCLRRNSAHTGCAAGIEEIEDAARRMYYKAYMNRKTSPEDAERWLKEVVAILPKGHEIRIKAAELLRSVGRPG